MSRLLEVGDIISVKNPFVNMQVVIERVTKTMAVSKPYNSAGAVYKFKRVVHNNNAALFRNIKWDTTMYTLIENKQ